ncbi:MAG: hypothetical protein PHF97_03890 [Bacteroidales bacterium]|nr:hypothetical protein [Bacteroidales bacterium]MDD4602931.1 hypothetical protein [Bacteroidales bacterium]
MEKWFFYVLFCTGLALSWFFHKDATCFSDRHELWSDRAGYYIYLPATFFYHFDTHKMPADLDIRTGGGFSVDTVHNKIDTKYTFGVALMVSPFFFTAHLVSLVAGFDDEDGFSILYMRMMALGAVVYLVLGLWFLHRFLIYYFQPEVCLILVALIFLGTNLFYYSLLDGMMSHVYSFFLISLFLFALKEYLNSRSFRYFILLSIGFAIAILIRPTNIILGFLFFFWDAEGREDRVKRLKHFLNPSCFLSFLAILIILFLPQFIYWKYLSGSWLHFSYRDEGFTNLAHPRILEVLFSPVNGWFSYTPLALFIMAGIVMMIFGKKKNWVLVTLVFLMITLICSSWKMWYFGCSYGQRSFIEYYPLLAIPLGWLITIVSQRNNFFLTTLISFLILIMVYFNLRYVTAFYRFERCYYGSSWDWDHYLRSIERAGILSPIHQAQSFENDFENLAISPVIKPSAIFTRSGQYGVATNTTGKDIPLFSTKLNDFGNPFPKMIEVNIWSLKPGNLPTGAALAYTLSKDDKILFSDEDKLDRVLKNPLEWTTLKKTFLIPDVSDSSLQIRLFIRNPKQKLIFFDDLKVHYYYRWNSN